MVPCPEILTGPILEDRKSVFQGHYAQVTDVGQVQVVLEKLKENRKIAHATHNMLAYRIKKGSLLSPNIFIWLSLVFSCF